LRKHRDPGRNNVELHGQSRSGKSPHDSGEVLKQRNRSSGKRRTEFRRSSPGQRLRVSMIQRVTLAGACLPSELAEESGEVRWELCEVLGRELAGDEAAERIYIVQQKVRMSDGKVHENGGELANI
jgi:hypothetical protein